jgi:hypothetical protein
VRRPAPSTPITLFFTALVAAAVWQTLGLGAKARLVPQVVAVPTLVLLLVQLAIDFVPGLARRFARLERKELIGVQAVREQVHPEHIVVREHPTPEDPGEPPSGELEALAWMGAMLGSALLLGFLVGGPLFALLYVRLHGRRPWSLALLVAAGLAAAIVGVFDWTLGAPLWRGWLWTWLGFPA